MTYSLISLKSSEEGRILSLVPGVEKNFDQKLSQSERIGRRFLPSDIAGSSRLNLRIFYLLDPPRYNMDCVSCVRFFPLQSGIISFNHWQIGNLSASSMRLVNPAVTINLLLLRSQVCNETPS